MRILITGASGFIGSHVTRFLAARHAEIGILCRPQADLWRLSDLSDRLTVLSADLLAPEQTERAVQEFSPDVLVHMGWSGVAAAHRDDAILMDKNVQASLRLFAACCRAGCRKIIGLGSQAEYGQRGTLLSEDMVPLPQSEYGKAKLLVAAGGAELCDSVGAGFTWLRLFSGYGPAEDADRLIPYVITSLLQKRLPKLSSGRQLWDYLHVSDVASAVAAVVDRDAGGVFNLCSGQPVLIRAVVEMIRAQLAPEMELVYGDDNVPDLVGSNEYLTDATGWCPSMELSEGLLDTINWYRVVSS